MAAQAVEALCVTMWKGMSSKILFTKSRMNQEFTELGEKCFVPRNNFC